MIGISIFQLLILIINLSAHGFMVVTIIRCAKDKIRLKCLFIIIILFFLYFGIIIISGDITFRFGFWMGLRISNQIIVIPAGAIIYWCVRKRYMKEDILDAVALNLETSTEYKGRAQCLVIKDNKILMVKHRHENNECYCSPGGSIEKGETPEQAALRELQEECNVLGTIIKKTSEYADPYNNENFFHTYHIDIGDQIPSLGYDPELTANPILTEVRWMSLDELSEVDRAFLWASGLLSISSFYEDLTS